MHCKAPNSAFFLAETDLGASINIGFDSQNPTQASQNRRRLNAPKLQIAIVHAFIMHVLYTQVQSNLELKFLESFKNEAKT